MNTQLAYTYLKRYYNWRKTKDNKDDQGLMVVLILLQSKFRLNFKLPYNAFSLKEAIEKVYQNTNDEILKHNGRQYLYIAYKKQINIENVYNKLISINISLENGNEIIHLILTIIFLEDVRYNKYMENILINLINILKLSDLKTEALYILFSINPYKIEQAWIDQIIQNQQSNGSLLCSNFEKYNDTQARHTSYGLILYLSYRKFKKTQHIIKIAAAIMIIIIYVYVYLSLKQYKANN
jgi:hypothetical protein